MYIMISKYIITRDYESNNNYCCTFDLSKYADKSVILEKSQPLKTAVSKS